MFNIEDWKIPYPLNALPLTSIPLTAASIPTAIMSALIAPPRCKHCGEPPWGMANGPAHCCPGSRQEARQVGIDIAIRLLEAEGYSVVRGEGAEPS